MRSARVSISTARRVDCAEDVEVDADAGLLHAEEDGDQREVDGVVDVVSVECSLSCADPCEVCDLDLFADFFAGGLILGRLICIREEHLGGDGAAEFGSVGGDVVLDGRGLCELPMSTAARRTMAAAASGRRFGSLGFSLVG